MGVWFNGRTAVSKTVDESSILSTPATLFNIVTHKSVIFYLECN